MPAYQLHLDHGLTLTVYAIDRADARDQGEARLRRAGVTIPVAAVTPSTHLQIRDDDWGPGMPARRGDPTPAAPTSLWLPITINDTKMHLEAWKVVPGKDPQRTYGHADEFDQLTLAVHADGPFQTTTIRGADYLLLATPHCR